jgi:hypothetical protein
MTRPYGVSNHVAVFFVYCRLERLCRVGPAPTGSTLVTNAQARSPLCRDPEILWFLLAAQGMGEIGNAPDEIVRQLPRGQLPARPPLLSNASSNA